jgi:F-type H+-transporting ATPase subunit delta
MITLRHIEREARRLFRWCHIDGSLNEDRIRRVVNEVVEGKHRGYLDLLYRFQRFVRLDQESRSAIVESATPLAADLQTQVESRLAGIYGPGLDIRFSQNPMLIGGMRIKVGSDVYDGSVQHELATLERSF